MTTSKIILEFARRNITDDGDDAAAFKRRFDFITIILSYVIQIFRIYCIQIGIYI